MNIAKRAVTSIMRRPGKTAILFLVVFILGNVIAFAVSMRQAVNNAEMNLRHQIGAVATIEEDYEALSKIVQETGEFPKYSPVGTETIKKVGALPNVRYYEYTASTTVYSETLEQYEGLSLYGDDNIRKHFGLKGVHNPAISDIKEKKIKLVSGRVFTEDEMDNTNYVTLISQNLADKNGLTIGSKIELDNIVFDDSIYRRIEGDGGKDYTEAIYASQRYTFEIIGIFDKVESANSGKFETEYLEEVGDANTLYVPIAVVDEVRLYYEEQINKLEPEKAQPLSYNSIFILEDPFKINQFRTEAAALLPYMYKITDSAEVYDALAGPMNSIRWIASMILIVSIIVSLIILSLLLILFLRDRKHEMGIYLSLGEKKHKIVAQVLQEVVVVSIAAIILSLFTGNLASESIAKNMLTNEIAAQQEMDNSTDNTVQTDGASVLIPMGYGARLSTDQLVENYKVSLDATTIMLFLLLGSGTVVFSTIIPILYLTKLNPKKILM